MRYFLIFLALIVQFPIIILIDLFIMKKRFKKSDVKLPLNVIKKKMLFYYVISLLITMFIFSGTLILCDVKHYFVFELIVALVSFLHVNYVIYKKQFWKRIEIMQEKNIKFENVKL